MSHKGYVHDSNSKQGNVKENIKPIRTVIPSSMVPIRAAIAKATAEAAARKRHSHKDGDDAMPNRKRSSSSLSGTKSRIGNKGVKSRDQLDRQTRKKEKITWKRVKSSLEKKTQTYEELMKGDTIEDQDSYLVDFDRKRWNESDLNVSHTTTTATTEENSQDPMVEMQDEFGRTILVSENSSKYRTFLAEEARKIRMEEIHRTRQLENQTRSRVYPNMEHHEEPYLEQDISFHKHEYMEQNILFPHANSSISSSGISPKTMEYSKELHPPNNLQQVTQHVTQIKANMNERSMRKKESRIELLRQKKLKRELKQKQNR